MTAGLALLELTLILIYFSPYKNRAVITKQLISDTGKMIPRHPDQDILGIVQANTCKNSFYL